MLPERMRRVEDIVEAALRERREPRVTCVDCVDTELHVMSSRS